VKLKEVLKGVPVLEIRGSADGEVAQVCCDSRRVRPGNLFVALKGEKADGHDFIGEVVAAGVQAVVVEHFVGQFPSVAQIRVADSHVALAQVAANLYRRPSEHLRVVGVTGTNGKTTATYLIASILEKGGSPSGVIGTLGCRIGNRQLPSLNTTPAANELQELFAQMGQAGMKAVVMEVSSHSLSQHRVDEIAWDAAVFTNLTRDHLDYHRTMEGYFGAKQKLFDRLGEGRKSAVAVLNADDPYSERIRGILKPNVRNVTYGLKASADVRAEMGERPFGVDGSRFRLCAARESVEVHTPLCGTYNVSNCLAAAAAGVAFGLELKTIRDGIESVRNVAGRLERVELAGTRLPFAVFVDYAHTDDALRNVLGTLRPLTGGRLVTVFGCGGNRDTTKRPLMGKVASELSDICIVTTDNPRNEEPSAIAEQVRAGCVEGRNCRVILERRAAIREALSEADEGDVVLLAGKGHETYQEIKGVRHPFDDRQVAREELEALCGANASGKPTWKN
jgi:UDP-N-acetylmuramoyl-L-alanyl-D-glutamate--2,6-diaminopimelate ligase